MNEETKQQLSAMMREQALLAAQAVAQAGAIGSGHPDSGEQVQLQRANLLMLIALNIP
jgi:acyl-coenzyme A synthetase/AMP-(fatty) acid ligase